MRKPSCVKAVGVSLILIGCLLSDAAAQTTEIDQSPLVAEFRGHPISHWVNRLRSGPVDDLTHAGESSLPVFVQAVHDPKASTWVRHTLQTKLSDATWTGPIYVEMLDTSGPFSRSFAMGHLTRNPDVAEKVASEIISRVRQWSKNEKSDEFDHVAPLIRVLIQLDPPPEETIQLVKEIWPRASTKTFLRWDLLELLARHGPKSVPVVSYIFLTHEPALRELQHFVRHVDKPTAMRIVAQSRNTEAATRRIAAAMIAQLVQLKDPPVKKTILATEIGRLLSDDDLHTRRHAADSARKMNGDASAVALIPILAANLHDADSVLRSFASSALADFGEPAIPELERVSRHKEPNARRAAGSAIASMNPVPSAGIDILLRLAEDTDSKVRNYAIFYLGNTRSNDPRVSEAIVDALEDSHTEAWAIRALGELGPNAEPAVELLQQKLATESLPNRLRVAKALWAINRDVARILPVVRAIAADDHGITSAGYFVRYRNVGGKRTEQRVPYRHPLAARAAELLGDMGPDAAGAVDDLIGLLDHENPRAKRAAYNALGKIGPAASKAVPKIKELAASNPSFDVESFLKKMEPSPDESK